MKFSKVLFWDIDPAQLDLEKHSSYVIERVVKFGTWDEWKELLNFYGSERVKQVVTKLSDLDPKTLSYLSAYFHLPKRAFRCYTSRQSTRTHYPSS